jgi:hypothetical protein
MQETTNITKLARAFHLSTTDAEKKLRMQGVEPVNEIVMPSGRRFVLWPKDDAIKTLKDYQQPPAEAQKKTPEPSREFDLSHDMAEVKRLLQEVLEHITRPQ